MYVHVHSSRDYPGMVCVSQESQDTRTRGMLQGELHVHVHSSRDYPGMVCVSQESQDTRTRGMLQGELHVHVHSFRDYHGRVCVSQESQDTWTRGMLQGELHVRTCTFIPGLSWDGLCIPGIPGYSDKGHAARRTTCTCTFILGLSWDGLCIPGVPGYSDKGHAARRTTCTCTFILGLSWDGLCIPGIPGYLDKGHATRRTTCTYMYIHPGIIPGWSVYPRNPRILGQGACCKENYMYMYIHPGIILGLSVYPRNPRIFGQEACCKENYMYVHVHSSRDYPGIVCVSQESQDTRTRGMLQGELHVRTCTFIPGLSWDCLCIPGIPGYSDKGHGARRTTCMYMYIHPGIILGQSVYPRTPQESQDTQRRDMLQGELHVHVHSSRDYPGMVCVPQDTQTKAWYMVVLDWASQVHPRII